MATLENLRVDHQLCLALAHASRAVNACYRPLLDDIGLTYSQYTVMLVLWERGRVSLGELRATLHLDSGTLSPLLQRLERAGLVSRERGVDDERTLLVEATERGRALMEPAADAQAAVEAATGLSADELERLRGQLDEVAARLRADR